MGDLIDRTIYRVNFYLLRSFVVLLQYLDKAMTWYQLVTRGLLRPKNDHIDMKGSFPLGGTVLTSLLVLLLFLFFSIPALKCPTIVVKKLVVVLGVTLVSVLILVFLIDIYTSKQRHHCKRVWLTSCGRK
jgi:protein-S-isoprenylcysteine O-methyltransferase Ste14